MDRLLDLLATYGWGGFTILLVVGLAYFFVIRQKSLSTFFNIDDEEASTDLKYHPFFRYAQHRMNVELPNLMISPDKPVKQEIFIDMLQILCKHIYNTCMTIANVDMSTWSSDRWGVELSNMMVESINLWTADCAAHDIPPQVIIKFKGWASQNFSLINEYIAFLADSPAYLDNKTRTNTFFLVMNLLLITLIGDAERTLRELNGEISGQLYKGKVIEH